MYLYLDTSLSAEERAKDLLSRMTVDQKIRQLIQGSHEKITSDIMDQYMIGSILAGGGSVPSTGNTPDDWRSMIDGYQTAMADTEFGIPIIYGIDSVHGHNHLKDATIFPHNIALGAANNEELTEKIARAAAIETASSGIHWTFAPCVATPQNIRWGRTYEGFSQDIDIAAKLTAASVRGFQGTTVEDYKRADTIAATIKHFALEGSAENGKNQGNVVLPEDYQTDEEYIENVLMPELAPYKAAIEAGALTVMASFNKINNLSCHQNYFLLTELLKKRLGFEGFVIGDYNAHVYVKDHEAYTDKYADCIFASAEDLAEVYAAQTSAVRRHVSCFNAGLDMFMCGGSVELVDEAIESLTIGYNVGLITDSRLDDAVYRILRVKFLLGLFDERRYADEEAVVLDAAIRSEEHLDIARQAVRESLVLLMNENDVVGNLVNNDKIFVCGKSADDIGLQCGGWTISWQGSAGAITEGTTILEGIEKNAGEREVTYSADGTGSTGYDVAIAVIGEAPYAETNGDATKEDLELSKVDGMCLQNIRRENPDIPIIVILVSGRPMLLGGYYNMIDGLVAAWLPGSEGDGVGEVLFNEAYDFTGKLPIDWPASYAGIDNTPTVGEELTGDNLWSLGYGLKKEETSEEFYVDEEVESYALALPGTIKLSEYVASSPEVGTESCSDTDGGKCVNYFENERFVRYLVNIEKSGYYKLTLRAATTRTEYVEDRVTVHRIDGETICGFDVPSTGGWQTWKSFETAGYFEAGEQYIELRCKNRGANINTLKFELLRESAPEGEPYVIIGAEQLEAEMSAGFSRFTYDAATETVKSSAFALADTDACVRLVLDTPATTRYLKLGIEVGGNASANAMVSALATYSNSDATVTLTGYVDLTPVGTYKEVLIDLASLTESDTSGISYEDCSYNDVIKEMYIYPWYASDELGDDAYVTIGYIAAFDDEASASGFSYSDRSIVKYMYGNDLFAVQNVKNGAKLTYPDKKPSGNGYYLVKWDVEEGCVVNGDITVNAIMGKVKPAALFLADDEALTLNASTGITAGQTVYDSFTTHGVYKHFIGSDDYTATDNTRIDAVFSAAGFPSDFRLKESPVIRIDMRSNVANTDLADINLRIAYMDGQIMHTGARLWGVRANYDTSGEWTSFILDLSTAQWTGGQLGASGNYASLTQMSQMTYWDSVWDELPPEAFVFKPYYGGKKLTANDYFDIAAISFFNSVEEAKAYEYSLEEQGYIKVEYTVNGEVFKTQYVESGSSLSYPEDTPSVTNRVFTGWSVPEGMAVTENMTVKASFRRVETVLVRTSDDSSLTYSRSGGLLDPVTVADNSGRYESIKRFNTSASTNADTSLEIRFGEDFFPEGFDIREASVMKIGYRAYNSAGAELIDTMMFIPYLKDSTADADARLWGYEKYYDADGVWNGLIYDLTLDGVSESPHNGWTGGQYGSANSWAGLSRAEGDSWWDGISGGNPKKVTLKPYFKTPTVTAGDYFDIAYIAFFNSVEDAAAYDCTGDDGLLLGDVDGDGYVAASDSVMLERYFAKWSGYGEDVLDLTVADVDADGEVVSADGVILARYLAKWDGYMSLPYVQ
ncbi:MAG: glycoside hydrolase family 3 C-terminal domain-containing protein [Clostridia bacterium]|nr:glycoside hydrolase family 3 C-terminal domain-containing protein [Clostridia bacterium]